jgi:hypothetical protein
MQTLVAAVLAAWRRAEELATALTPTDPGRERAVYASDRLRDLYEFLTARGTSAHGRSETVTPGGMSADVTDAPAPQ